VNYAQLLFPDFSLILIGYLVCRYTALNRTVWLQVESLVYFLLFPVLLFQSIVKTPLDLNAASSLIMAGVTMGMAAIGLSYTLPHLPWLCHHIVKRRSPPESGLQPSGVGLFAERLSGPPNARVRVNRA
jgi:malonate transporter